MEFWSTLEDIRITKGAGRLDFEGISNKPFSTYTHGNARNQRADSLFFLHRQKALIDLVNSNYLDTDCFENPVMKDASETTIHEANKSKE